MTRGSRKAVIASLKLKVGITNSGGDQPEKRMPFRPLGPREVTHLRAAGFQMNRDHAFAVAVRCAIISRMRAMIVSIRLR